MITVLTVLMTFGPVEIRKNVWLIVDASPIARSFKMLKFTKRSTFRVHERQKY